MFRRLTELDGALLVRATNRVLPSVVACATLGLAHDALGALLRKTSRAHLAEIAGSCGWVKRSVEAVARCVPRHFDQAPPLHCIRRHIAWLQEGEGVAAFVASAAAHPQRSFAAGRNCTWRFQEGLELARIRQPGGVGNDSELRTAQRVSENVKPWHLRSLLLQAFSLSLP